MRLDTPTMKFGTSKMGLNNVNDEVQDVNGALKDLNSGLFYICPAMAAI